MRETAFMSGSSPSLLVFDSPIENTEQDAQLASGTSTETGGGALLPETGGVADHMLVACRFHLGPGEHMYDKNTDEIDRCIPNALIVTAIVIAIAWLGSMFFPRYRAMDGLTQLPAVVDTWTGEVCIHLARDDASSICTTRQ